MLADSRHRLLRYLDEDKAAVKTARPDARPESNRAQRAIVCLICRHPVTSEAQGISVNQSHEHVFANPHGIVFHIGCFRDAPGCLPWGTATFDFTWFPGFAWRHALCAGCHTHLGWRFEGGSGDSFFGLVLNRLAREEIQ